MALAEARAAMQELVRKHRCTPEELLKTHRAAMREIFEAHKADVIEFRNDVHRMIAAEQGRFLDRVKKRVLALAAGGRGPFEAQIKRLGEKYRIPSPEPKGRLHAFTYVLAQHTAQTVLDRLVGRFPTGKTRELSDAERVLFKLVPKGTEEDPRFFLRFLNENGTLDMLWLAKAMNDQKIEMLESFFDFAIVKAVGDASRFGREAETAMMDAVEAIFAAPWPPTKKQIEDVLLAEVRRELSEVKAKIEEWMRLEAERQQNDPRNDEGAKGPGSLTGPGGRAA